MIPSFQLDAEGQLAAEEAGKNLNGGLDQAFRPARLLGLEGGHLDGKLGRALHILQVDETPAFELGAIAEVGILGQGVMLPAAGLVDGLAPPDAGGAVEVEKDAAARAGPVLENEVPVEQDGLHFSQE